MRSDRGRTTRGIDSVGVRLLLIIIFLFLIEMIVVRGAVPIEVSRLRWIVNGVVINLNVVLVMLTAVILEALIHSLLLTVVHLVAAHAVVVSIRLQEQIGIVCLPWSNSFTSSYSFVVGYIVEAIRA